MSTSSLKAHDVFSIKRMEFEQLPKHLAEFLATIEERSPAAKRPVLVVTTKYGAEDAIVCIRLSDLLELAKDHPMKADTPHDTLHG